MARGGDTPLRFYLLYTSPLVRVRDYRCRAGCGGPADEEHSGAGSIVLMRHGVFCKHVGQRSVTADVNHAVFFSPGSAYRISHPADCGDRGTVFEPALHVLGEIVRELDPARDDSRDFTFPFVTGPCDADAFWRHRELVRRLETPAAESPEPLWADETILQLIADVMSAGFSRHDLRRKRSRLGTEADHVERTESAKTYLASHFGERITLDEVARVVHTSPFHFARIFQQRCGVPVHRYLTRLRLRASLEHLADDGRDLTGLALQLGFTSHSHFADAFRREFGCTPSTARRRLGRRALREMSKKLEV